MSTLQTRAGLAIYGLLICILTTHARAESGVTFYAGFEGTMDAALSAGQPIGNTDGKTAHFQEGMRGQAFLAGDGEPFVEYSGAGNLSTPEGSVEMWVKSLNWAMPCWGFHRFFVASGSATGISDAKGQAAEGTLMLYKFGHHGGRLLAYVVDAGSPVAVESKNPFGRWNAGVWNHLVMAWDKDEVRLYFNGEACRPDVLPKPLAMKASKFCLGDDPWANASRGAKIPEWVATADNRNAKTLVDEVYLYNRALSDEEVAWALANGNKRQPGQDIPRAAVQAITLARVTPQPAEKALAVEVRIHPLFAGEGNICRATMEGPEGFSGKTDIALKDGREGTGVFSCPSFPKGKFKVTVVLQDKNGKALGKREGVLESPGPAIWVGNQIGNTPLPPKPYTPIKEKGAVGRWGDRFGQSGLVKNIISGSRKLLEKYGFIRPKQEAAGFSCWNREITFDQSGFVKSVLSGGEELLARPMALESMLKGKPVVWKGKSFRKISGDANRIIWESEAESEIGTLSMKITAEYDGMIRYDMRLTPKVKTEVDRLELRLPVREDKINLSYWPKNYSGEVYETFTDWMEHNEKDDASKGAGGVAPFEGPWTIYVWLGNEDKGISGVLESDEAWDKVGRKDAVRMERSPGSMDIVWSFAKEKWVLPDPWRLTIGIQATPVKLPPSRKWRYGKGSDTVPGANFHIYWTEPAHMPFYGYPAANNDFTNVVARYKERGVGLTPYSLLSNLAVTSPEYLFYFERYRMPNKKPACGGDMTAFGKDSGLLPIALAPDYIDFLVWKNHEFVTKFGLRGLYHDLSCAYPFTVAEAGCGYERDGKRLPTHPVFALRELYRRIYTMLKTTGDEKGEEMISIIHVGPFAWLNAFTDFNWIGEACKENYLRSIKPGSEMKIYSGHNLGFRCLWLPEPSASAATTSVDKKDARGRPLQEFPEEQTRYLVAMLWLHDMSLTPVCCNLQVACEMFLAMDRFGDFPDAKFLPYWKNQGIIKGQEPDKLLCSAYLKPQPDAGALLCVVNASDQPKTAALSLDLKALHAGPEPQVRDMAGDMEIPLKEGRIEVAVKPRDFRLLRVK